MAEIKDDISKIDSNFVLENTLGLDDVKFYDIRQSPFDIYGLYKPELSPFRRLEEKVAESVSTGVTSLNFNTAGGRVRFKTDSPYIAIKVKMPKIRRMSHMAFTGSSGFDLFEVNNGIHRYIKTFVPPTGMTDGYESLIRLSEGGMRDYIINFPLYDRVSDLFVGLQKDSMVLHGGKYSVEKPILYYGSSITQGGCASRPGNSYQAMLSRRFDCDYINLGFSGNAKGEKEMADYLATIDSSVFVLDYDYNAPNPEHLKNTHYNVYKTYRDSHPDTPIVIASAVVIDKSAQKIERRKIVYDTYLRAKSEGDEKVAFVDGFEIFTEENRNEATVDGAHPTDYGFMLMADAIEKAIGLFL